MRRTSWTRLRFTTNGSAIRDPHAFEPHSVNFFNMIQQYLGNLAVTFKRLRGTKQLKRTGWNWPLYSCNPGNHNPPMLKLYSHLYIWMCMNMTNIRTQWTWESNAYLCASSFRNANSEIHIQISWASQLHFCRLSGTFHFGFMGPLNIPSISREAFIGS